MYSHSEDSKFETVRVYIKCIYIKILNPNSRSRVCVCVDVQSKVRTCDIYLRIQIGVELSDVGFGINIKLT